MMYSFVIGITLLACSGILSGAQSRVNPSDEEKTSTTITSPTAPESLAKLCSPTNPPPCAEPPRAVSAPPAEVPQETHGKGKKGKKGVSVLSVVVEPDGSTSHIRVVKPVGLGLDEKAIEAVKTWKFKPATLNGKPVAVEIAVEIHFHIY